MTENERADTKVGISLLVIFYIIANALILAYVAINTDACKQNNRWGYVFPAKALGCYLNEEIEP